MSQHPPMRREDTIRNEKVQEAIQRSREVLGEARIEPTQGVAPVVVRMHGYPARMPTDRERYEAQRRGIRSNGARPA